VRICNQLFKKYKYELNLKTQIKLTLLLGILFRNKSERDTIEISSKSFFYSIANEYKSAGMEVAVL